MKIIVAMDVPSHQAATTLAQRLDPKLCRLKVGMELFTAAGPAVVEDLQKLGFKVFLDLKYKDIPNTVAGAVLSAANLGVWMLNVHCDGGREMMEAAVNAVANHKKKPLIIGVTILTSMDINNLKEVGVQANVTLDQVLQLAELAEISGLDGVVCSGKEVESVHTNTHKGFISVVPGIRLPDGNQNDQKRIITPEEAIRLGAHYLVVGRPITGASDPIAALNEFNARVKSVI
jgi:orotidine-5'-phosphate decarboxylase